MDYLKLRGVHIASSVGPYNFPITESQNWPINTESIFNVEYPGIWNHLVVTPTQVNAKQVKNESEKMRKEQMSSTCKTIPILGIILLLPL